jgi:hypothetical protein
MDYSLNGIRSKWCFSSSWSPNSACTLTDPNNVERLLLSDEALRAIEASMPPAAFGGKINVVRTKSISVSVPLKTITEVHPLYYIKKGLIDISDELTFNFQITRMDNGVVKGREVALEVQVSIDLGNFLGVKSFKNLISLVSTVMVFPREINTNALLVANNLYLDRPDPGIAGAGNGDVYIPPMQSEVPGLRFESPVFVNTNVYIPNSTAPSYTPVTFADKVIIGSGGVQESTGSGAVAIYSAPRSAGGLDDMYYSQINNFGGFLGGVLLDPTPDQGLYILGQVKLPTTKPNIDVNLCLLRNNGKIDLSVTRNSQLFSKFLDTASLEAAATDTVNVTSNYKFVLDLGSVDSFYMQGVSGQTQFQAYSPTDVKPTVTLNDAVGEQRPIFRVNVALNGWGGNTGAYVAADMSRNSVVEIPMNPTDATAKIIITSTPYTKTSVVQSQAVNVSVQFVNQEKFNMLPYSVKLGSGSTVATSMEPDIDIRVEAFDVAYNFDLMSNSILSKRIKGSPGNLIPAADCPVGSSQYTTDVETDGGVTYHCISQFAWHPIQGKYKYNGFIFERAPGGTEKRFVLKRKSGDVGVSGGFFTCPFYDTSLCPPVYDAALAPMDEEFVAYDLACNAPPKGTDLFPSFAAASWDTTSFVDQARHSWSFTEGGTAPGFNNPGKLILDANNARFDGTHKPIFVISAIYDTCEITADANFVTGFFVCDNLIVDRRQDPLRIIGTFIVSKMSMDPSAYTYGVRWSNIYHPSAVYELRTAGVLNTSVPGEDCDVPTDPLWQPYPSIQRVQYLYKCNPISLRNKADPFRWTSVDPDCGLDTNKVQTCKYRVERYQLIELRRQEFL